MIISPISVVVSSRSVDSCTTASISSTMPSSLGVATGRFSHAFKPLQDFLPFESLAPSVLLNHHVRDFIDTLVSGESPAALQAFAPAANGVAPTAFPRINHFVINVRTKRTLHEAGLLACY